MVTLIVDARHGRNYKSIDEQQFQAAKSTGSNTVSISVFAVDLISDTWEDSGYFLEKVHDCEKSFDLALRHRFLRASISSLFSHLEGVVAEVYRKLNLDQLWRTDPTWKKRGKELRCKLKLKIDMIRDYIDRNRLPSVGELDVKLKLIRDILQHPHIEKRIEEDDPSSETLTQIDIYNVESAEVAAARCAIDTWLNQLCASVKYDRFIDTKLAAEAKHAEFIQKLGTSVLHTGKSTTLEF